MLLKDSGQASWFMTSVSQSISEVFSQALASEWTAEFAEEDSIHPTDENGLLLELALTGGVTGNASLQIGATDAIILACKFLGETPGDSLELDGNRKEAVEELLRQVAGVMTTNLKMQRGETQIQVGRANVVPPGQTGFVLNISESGAAKLDLHFSLSAELLANITTHAMQQKSEPALSLPVPEAPKSKELNFDRMNGVRLALSLRFGGSSLTLSELLGLGSGSIVELDRHVNEPAELILSGRVVARGEVVVVDGNYGIRIAETFHSSTV